MSDTRTVTAADGELLLYTGTAGRAARTGHKLTIRMNQWTAETTFDDDGHEIDKRENRAVLRKAMCDWLTSAFAS